MCQAQGVVPGIVEFQTNNRCNKIRQIAQNGLLFTYIYQITDSSIDWGPWHNSSGTQTVHDLVTPTLLATNTILLTTGKKTDTVQLCTTVPVLIAPQIASDLYSWLGDAEGALRMALAARYPPRDAEHGYTNSRQNDQENDTYKAGNHRPSGNNL